MFRIGYTVPGVWYLLRRNGGMCQQPARCAIERADGAVEVWRQKGLAGRGKTAVDLGACICFEGECGKTMRPPPARTWARRGCPRWCACRFGAAGSCRSPGCCATAPATARLLYRLHRYHCRTGEEAGFTWTDYRGFLRLAHHGLHTPIVLG